MFVISIISLIGRKISVLIVQQLITIAMNVQVLICLLNSLCTKIVMFVSLIILMILKKAFTV